MDFNPIDLILHLDTYLAMLVSNYGVWIYAILFLVIFCETGLVVTPFLPGDSLLFIAGSFIWSKELTTFARDATTQNGNATPLIMAALLYLVVTIPLTRFSAWLERRMARQR